MDILDLAFEDEALDSGENIIINSKNYICVADPMKRFIQDNARHAGKYDTQVSVHILKSSGILFTDLKPQTNANYKNAEWQIIAVEDDNNAIRLTLDAERGEKKARF